MQLDKKTFSGVSIFLALSVHAIFTLHIFFLTIDEGGESTPGARHLWRRISSKFLGRNGGRTEWGDGKKNECKSNTEILCVRPSNERRRKKGSAQKPVVTKNCFYFQNWWKTEAKRLWWMSLWYLFQYSILCPILFPFFSLNQGRSQFSASVFICLFNQGPNNRCSPLGIDRPHSESPSQ